MKYTIEFKQKLVNECVNEHCSTKELSEKYGVSEIHLRRWVKLYKLHGIEGLNHTKKKHYDSIFKNYVIKYMENNQLSFFETAMIFNIPKDSTISDWYKKYKENDSKEPAKENEMNKTNKNNNKNLKELIDENEKLRAENAYLKKLQALIQERNNQDKKKK